MQIYEKFFSFKTIINHSGPATAWLFGSGLIGLTGLARFCEFGFS